MEKYEILRLLGKGSFGSVYVARSKVDSSLHVVKKISVHNLSTKERQAAEQEAKVLQRFHHPGIVPLEDSFVFKGRQLCIVMELCEGGDLSGKIEKRAGRRQYFKEEEILDWLLQICLALQYIHGEKILHRDLKTQNIFLTKDNQVKLGDFGIARVLEGTLEMAKTVIGTPYYMSPELFRNQPYSYKSDIWSLGCVLYELCALRHAFEARDMDGLVQKILRANYPPLPSGYTKDMQALVKSLLQPVPNHRPSIEHILQLGFLRKRMGTFLSAQLGDAAVNEIMASSDEKSLARRELIKQAESMGVDMPQPQPPPSKVDRQISQQPKLGAMHDPGRARERESAVPSRQHQVNERQRKAEELLAREQRAKGRAENALRKLQEEKQWRARESELQRQRQQRRTRGVGTNQPGAEVPVADWRQRLSKAQEEARSRHARAAPSVFGMLQAQAQMRHPPSTNASRAPSQAAPREPSRGHEQLAPEPPQETDAYGHRVLSRRELDKLENDRIREREIQEVRDFEAKLRRQPPGAFPGGRALNNNNNNNNNNNGNSNFVSGYAQQAAEKRLRGDNNNNVGSLQRLLAAKQEEARRQLQRQRQRQIQSGRPRPPASRDVKPNGYERNDNQNYPSPARQDPRPDPRAPAPPYYVSPYDHNGRGPWPPPGPSMRPAYVYQPDNTEAAVVEEESGLVPARDLPPSMWHESIAADEVEEEVGAGVLSTDTDMPFEQWLEHKRAAIEESEKEVARRTLTVQMLEVTLGRKLD